MIGFIMADTVIPDKLLVIASPWAGDGRHCSAGRMGMKGWLPSAS